jgi:putative cardiolipin synthase
LPAQQPPQRHVSDPPAAHPQVNGLQLLSSGLKAFDARMMSARGAVRCLDLMYYVWNKDFTGRILMSEVVAAADRGVQVRLLLDDIGVSSRDKVLRALNSHPGIVVRLFNPFSTGKASRWGLRRIARRLFSMTRRMHNKAWIADGRSAIMGGRNIGDAYFDAAELSNFRDLDLLATGPVVAEAEAMLETYWDSIVVKPLRPAGDATDTEATLASLRAFCDSAEARRYLAMVQQGTSPFAPDQTQTHWCASAQLVADLPAKARGRRGKNSLMAMLLPILEAARQRVAITSPYFVPGRGGTNRLTALAARGVEVKILTNSLAATDVAAVHGAYAHYRRPLLQAGVALHELRPTGRRERLSFRGKSHASLHTKAFTVDGTTGFVGSLNFDPRSTSLNTEMGLIFEAPELVAVMDRLFAEETAPDASYALHLDKEGHLCWLGSAGETRDVRRREPGASLMRRAIARVVGWLPLESQL